MTDSIDQRLDKIAEDLATIKAMARVSKMDGWMSAEEIAAYLNYSVHHVRERLVCRVNFPQPMRVDRGHPRWKKSEIEAWADRERERTGGRKRRQTQE